MKLTVSEPMPLLDALASMAPQSSKNTLRSWIKEGRVQIDGKAVKNASVVLSSGQEITISKKRKWSVRIFRSSMRMMI